MLTFVLVRAGEGETKEICVAHGQTLAALVQVVTTIWNAQITDFPLPWTAGNQGFLVEERDALVAMLAGHPCTPGRYVLAPIYPIWEQVTLVIADVAISLGNTATGYRIV
jgi:hypothetical protein